MGFGLGWVWGRVRMGSGGLVGGLGKGFGGLGLEMGSLPILSISSLCSPYFLFDNVPMSGATPVASSFRNPKRSNPWLPQFGPDLGKAALAKVRTM